MFPVMPDRTQWLNDPAYNQWTLDEIEQGLLKSLDIPFNSKYNNIMKMKQENCEGSIFPDRYNYNPVT